MYRFAERMDRVDASAVREILKLTANPKIISFGGGSPASESFPVEAIREITDNLLTKSANTVLQYGVTEGWKPLRNAYIDHVARPKGVLAETENVLITTGSTQGIQLATDVFLNEGDTVLTESPTFLSALMVFRKHNCKCIAVESDHEGILPDDLKAKMQAHHPRMLYCIPTFQNPTGTTISLERRKEIARLAEKYNVIIVEDDPYCDLRYTEQALPPIKHFDRSDHVILLNSFSKIITPGLRVGVVVAHPEIIAKMTVAKQCTDTHSCTLSQAICADFLNRDMLPAQLERIIPLYRERRDAMIDGIRRYFPKDVEYQVPDGGLFVWIKLPEHFDIDERLRVAISKYNVAFVPGMPFFIDTKDGIHTIRLNFSSNPPERIKIGMQGLGEVFQ